MKKSVQFCRALLIACIVIAVACAVGFIINGNRSFEREKNRENEAEKNYMKYLDAYLAISWQADPELRNNINCLRDIASFRETYEGFDKILNTYRYDPEGLRRTMDAAEEIWKDQMVIRHDSERAIANTRDRLTVILFYDILIGLIPPILLICRAKRRRRFASAGAPAGK